MADPNQVQAIAAINDFIIVLIAQAGWSSLPRARWVILRW